MTMAVRDHGVEGASNDSPPFRRLEAVAIQTSRYWVPTIATLVAFEITRRLLNRAGVRLG